jgi:NADPH-dependent glutamate synthase beta subunit-like oxidoreductase/Pyruvate/2-oxoacid:ferredoxin oxidoreductase delta subunit
MKRPLDESFDEAWYLLTDKNPMPAIHGRICPHPCEEGCNRRHKEDGAVAINNFERYIGDRGLKRKLKLRKITDEKKNKRIAVIGSGPSGLSCAYQMARRGYAVTIFEAFEKPGGMLRYGIPSYRLPEDILDQEINNILDLGVQLKCNTRIGQDIDFKEIRKEFDSIYLAIGAHKGIRLGISGEDSANIFTGASYLNRIKSGAKVEIGNKVVVIGGGDSAVDAARVSLRLSGDEPKTALDSAQVTKRIAKCAKITILYRRTKNEMPAIKQDIEEAEKEGINFEFLSAPAEFVTENGRVVAIKCTRMKLGEPDESGRQRPVPIPGKEFTLSADTIIVGIGQSPELAGGMSELANKWGWLDVNKKHETQMSGIFAGGDALGLGISTRSVGHGREAARAMDAHLSGKEYKPRNNFRTIKHTDIKLDYYPSAKRNEEGNLPVSRRISSFDEVNQTITSEQAIAESKRCMSCGLCFACNQCRVFCPREAISRNLKRDQGKVMFTDYTRCNGCHICSELCPSGYIQMGMGL